MSIFLPYSPTDVLTYYTNLFSVDLTSFTAYETLIATILSNLYFFIYWGVIVYFKKTFPIFY